MEGQKVLIGMSGGVDSSVAALLMQQEGYECIGATMQLYPKEVPASGGTKICGSNDDVRDAQLVAERLGIPHCVLRFREAFEETVIADFVQVYEKGATPNPCICCNRHLKFGRMLQAALDMGCDYVVSGHYARIEQDPQTGRYLLKRAADRAKDQTYFLYTLTQEQLAHIRFPLGTLTKPEVREIADAHGFLNARKHDSQDICFVPDGNYAAFLKRYTGKDYPSGDFLDLDGKKVGTHKGAVCYTIGQRKGLGIALGEPVYVCKKDMAANTVTVGPNDVLFSKGLLANDWFWFPFPQLTEPMAVTAKIRHSQFDQPAMVYPEANGFVRVIFETPQRAVSPGQAVVLYSGDTVIGGGTITEAIS